MTENVENLMLEHLKALRAGQDRIEFELKEVKTRLTHLESTVIGSRRDAVSTQEDVYRQQNVLDRMNDRINQIEKLLQHTTA